MEVRLIMDEEKNKDFNTSEENISTEDTLKDIASTEGNSEKNNDTVQDEPKAGVKTEEVAKNEDSSNDSVDLGKVKIRQVLMHRIKNCKPNFKKIIAFILIAVVFFGAGLFAGRGITKHKLGRNINGKTSIQRKMQKGFGRNKNFKINGGNKTQTPARGQTQN
jgi:hypothetical protein